jgi:hypothetical protein
VPSTASASIASGPVERNLTSILQIKASEAHMIVRDEAIQNAANGNISRHGPERRVIANPASLATEPWRVRV